MRTTQPACVAGPSAHDTTQPACLAHESAAQEDALRHEVAFILLHGLYPMQPDILLSVPYRDVRCGQPQGAIALGTM